MAVGPLIVTGRINQGLGKALKECVHGRERVIRAQARAGLDVANVDRESQWLAVECIG